MTDQPRRHDGRFGSKPPQPPKSNPNLRAPSSFPDPDPDASETGDGVNAALRERLVLPTVAAPLDEVDAHLIKCDEHLQVADLALGKGLNNPAAAAGYEGAHQAVEALMASRGVRVNKNNPAGLGDHAARIQYLRHELRHAGHLGSGAADDIADTFDHVRELRNAEAYRPVTIDEKSAKAAVVIGRKVARQVLILLGRDEADMAALASEPQQ